MKWLKDKNNNFDPERTSKAKLTSAAGALVLATTEVVSYLGIEIDVPDKLIWSAAFTALFFIRRAM